MKYFSGQLYRGNRFQKGYICVESEIIVKVGTRSCPVKPVAKGIIIPTFINAHTHIGDTSVKFKPDKIYSYEQLVAPPNGLKHKELKRMPPKLIMSGIKASINVILSTGTSSFVDFRESGINGVRLLKKALSNSPAKGIILGRPANLKYDKREVDEILRVSHGIGISSISDWDYSELVKLSKHTLDANKFFALHVSERVRENIDKVLDLKPKFIVHMNEATDSDLKRCAEANVPVVICPRSNLFFGKIPDIPKLLRNGCEIMIGTDNAMISRPNLFDEINMTYTLARLKGGITAREILRAIIENPRKNINGIDDMGFYEGGIADFMVIESESTNPETEIIAHGSSSLISYMQIGKWHWGKRK